jgi:glycerol-3-phosphate dehydrogenase
MIRRTSWHYYHRNRDAIAEQVARWKAEIIGWDEAKVDEELARYRAANCAASTTSTASGTQRNFQQVH